MAETPRGDSVAAPRAPSVWIVVLNWNGLADTLDCLQSLRQLHYAERHVVVVDNGSTDDSVEALRRAAAAQSFALIETGRNLGFAGGNNVGIRYALERGADFVLVLNNDTTVDPRLLDELVEAARAHPRAGSFGPWIYHMHDPERLWFAGAAWSSQQGSFSWPGKGRLASELTNEVAHTDYVCGAALFVRADVARRIGVLDERYFLVYEESDWCFRARRAGFDCLMVPSARVWHKVGASFGSEESPLRTYFSTRNKMLWAERHAPTRDWLRIVRSTLGGRWPRLRIDAGNGIPIHKAVLWACGGYARDLVRRLRNPQEVAHRRAILDYGLRRFGDCPPRIRALARAWSERRDAARAAGAREP